MNVISKGELFQHLELIQNVVLRMSTASSNTKSWLFPVIAGVYSFAISEHSILIALVGQACVLLFAYLDANYLEVEKKYIFLYSLVLKNDPRVELYSLDISQIVSVGNTYELISDTRPTRRSKWFPGNQALSSWSVIPYYSCLFVIGVIIEIFLSAGLPG